MFSFQTDLKNYRLNEAVFKTFIHFYRLLSIAMLYKTLCMETVTKDMMTQVESNCCKVSPLLL